MIHPIIFFGRFPEATFYHSDLVQCPTFRTCFDPSGIFSTLIPSLLKILYSASHHCAFLKWQLLVIMTFGKVTIIIQAGAHFRELNQQFMGTKVYLMKNNCLHWSNNILANPYQVLLKNCNLISFSIISFAFS